ncbi:amino acid adenylation domain-containing protein [Blautia sp. LMAG:75]|uniref:amino acid adenylation domain-containing protein n=1 Tax=Blautia sp. LMAG:75 TaxID=1969171 RepID=UPI0025C58D16|nr:amino acid adenylation domain-containing protein [Blautia sp. LMAG:75]
MDGLFLEAADKFPDKEALVTCSRRMTYREIKEEAFYISGQLKSMGIKKEETVAVFMEKGWEQVVAVYGILFAGAAYLPIDIHNPRERVEKILRDSGTRIILVQNQAYDQDTEWLHEWDCISVSGLKTDSEYKAQENKAGDLAYVIYTSGTTGMPKGVMITHHNAVNTILDINARYQITEQDTAFGISNLHFDLSVYDVFGVLGAGGKLVLPDPEYGKDPAHWIHWLNHENITVWNSVPAFVEMLAEYEEYQRQVTSQSLRLVMMSGDWVPVSLPGRIRNLFQNVEIVALGGATEGSIWSNHFEIPEIVPEDWKSIPYGKPLANQKYYVLDQNMEDCPDWVPGTLYIAGDGVAQGYLNDNEKTEEKFVVLDRTGERLYCTGDMGRYWNEGNIEFLGRLDNQVKINGYRVELGEIEAALRRIQGITEAFVFFKRDNAIEDICAVLVEEKRYRDRIDKFYKEMLKKDLPIYMIPTEYIKTNAIPLNSNGKKDIHKILIVAEKNRKPIFKKNNNCKQLTQLQEQLLAIWREVLKIENIDINDNFFEIGGNSIQAIQITNQMTEKIGCFMDIGKLFEYPTISKIERYILEET